MTNPLIIQILEYLRKKNSSCSLIDLVNLCEPDFQSLLQKKVDPQIVIFQKNFFIMNALYQIQRDIQTEGFTLTIFPLDIHLIPHSNCSESSLATRDKNLADYYVDWSNLTNVTAEEVELLFSSFWKKYGAVDKVDAALTTLALEKKVSWPDIRKAYQKKILICHPDKGGCTEDFIATREAYEILRCSYK
jgi:hypothetical protein